jgi:hypothetical protein
LLQLPSLGSLFVFFNKQLPKGSFLMGKMKIVKFYLNKASYIAENDFGIKINLDIDYWNNDFKLSNKNVELANFAKKLLKKKHKVNFVYKMIE